MDSKVYKIKPPLLSPPFLEATSPTEAKRRWREVFSLFEKAMITEEQAHDIEQQERAALAAAYDQKRALEEKVTVLQALTSNATTEDNLLNTSFSPEAAPVEASVEATTEKSLVELADKENVSPDNSVEEKRTSQLNELEVVPLEVAPLSPAEQRELRKLLRTLERLPFEQVESIDTAIKSSKVDAEVGLSHVNAALSAEGLNSRDIINQGKLADLAVLIVDPEIQQDAELHKRIELAYSKLEKLVEAARDKQKVLAHRIINVPNNLWEDANLPELPQQQSSSIDLAYEAA